MITTPGAVRDVAGLDKEKGISEEQIYALINVAQKHLVRDLFQHHYQEIPRGNPNTGALWDGSNTSFKLCDNIADTDFDQTTEDDVTGTWLSSTMAVDDLTIVVTSARYGYVTITKDDGNTPLPSTAEAVHVDYYTSYKEIPFDTLEQMGTYLTAHLVELRLTQARNISLADLESNKMMIMQDRTRYLKEYRALKDLYAEPLLLGC